MKKIFLGFFFLIFLNGFSQEYNVFAKTDTTNIRIGEQFLYAIITDNVKGVLFPVSDSLGLESLEVLKEYNVDTLKDKLVKKYLLTGFDSGSFYIPNQAVFIDKKAYFTDSLPIKIATVKVKDSVIYPVKGIEEEPMLLKDYAPKFILFFSILIFILLALLGFYIYKKYKKKKEKKNIPQKHPFEEAQENFAILDAKDDYLQPENAKDYYTELTEIVRTYLGRRFDIHTLEATTDEILKNLAAKIKNQNLEIDKKIMTALSDFLKHADFVKFAKLIPLVSEMKEHRAKSWSIVENFEKVLKAKEQEQKIELDKK